MDPAWESNLSTVKTPVLFWLRMEKYTTTLSSGSSLKVNTPLKLNLTVRLFWHCIRKKGADFVDDLNGIFAFALYDSNKDTYFIARDHMGIIPLYMGWDKEGTFYVASELKALEGICSKIELFPPGHYWQSGDVAPTHWYKRDWRDYDNVKNNPTSIEELHDALSDAVHRQLMRDVPYGVLLSGGLDSSITSALAKKFSKGSNPTIPRKLGGLNYTPFQLV